MKITNKPHDERESFYDLHKDYDEADRQAKDFLIKHGYNFDGCLRITVIKLLNDEIEVLQQQQTEAAEKKLNAEKDGTKPSDKKKNRRMEEDYFGGETQEKRSTEYLRMLCGYLFCIGTRSDAALIERAKYDISFDTGIMIDGIWIDILSDQGGETDKEDIIDEFMDYYDDYFDMEFVQHF
jgi:hypothetical protein